MKDPLLKQTWADTFVEEVNIAVNVSMLRKALGESPQVLEKWGLQPMVGPADRQPLI